MGNERENEITYRKEGDYYVTNLVIPKDEYANYYIGKYGHLRLTYLKENRKAEYSIMMMEGTLKKHIIEIDIVAKSRVDSIINSLRSKSDLIEEMKNFDPLYWVGMMNNFRNEAEEIVLKELIYV
jgi:tnpV protein